MISFYDLLRFTFQTLRAEKFRSFLTILGIVIGIASAILLTSIGEGTRQYILSEFTQFGSNLLQVTPGVSKTSGPAGIFGGTTNPLKIDDAVALERVPGIEKVVPAIFGTAEVRSKEHGRNVFIYGVTSDASDVWKFEVRQGSFLPKGDPNNGGLLCVLGPNLKHELFGDKNALGEHVRIGGERFTVIGVMAPKGYVLGFDIDDAAYIPVSRGLNLFNRDELMEIDILFSSAGMEKQIKESIRKFMVARHRGEEDFTIVTQTEMLTTMDKIITIINYAVGGIAAISLLVGAIGILTMIWISVNERTREIGLAKALGAKKRQILLIFLAEASILSTIGGVIGVCVAYLISFAIHIALPKVPLSTPIEFVIIAIAVSFGVGILSGILPARRAAFLDPVEALSAE